MKKLIPLIVLIAIGGLCYSQKISEQKYKELSKLFARDVQLKAKNIETYSSVEIIKSTRSYTHSTIMVLPENDMISGDIIRILIIVNSSIYSQVPTRIIRYGCDINYIYGCEVIMEQVSDAGYEDIRNLIISKGYLNGVVLIGDIPTAWYEVANDHNQYGYAKWPCDLYYMDTNGTWGDADGDDIFDSHTGGVQPEIFVGRISTANMGNLVSEKEGLENYLDKNHMFWMGQLTVNNKYGLSYTDEDWADESSFKSDIQYLYGSSNYYAIDYFSFPGFGKTDYLKRLSNNRYEFIQLACHSDYSFHAMTGGYIFSSQIFNNETEAIGYNLFCCSACDWTSASPGIGFLGGAYIYNSNTSGLVLVGSTKTGSMLEFEEFYDPLGEGYCFGEAYLEWWDEVCGTYPYWHSDHIICWYYGLTILGDPLVNFYHCIYDRCENQIILSTFNNSNPSPFGYYLAKDKITINSSSNYIIPSGKHVIFNSPNVDIIKNFQCEQGGSFEIINGGCKSNCP